MKKILALLAVAVLLPVGSAMADPGEELRKATDFIKAGDKDAARPILAEILADESASPSVKAQVYFVYAALEKEPADQIPFLDKAIATDPGFFRAYERKAIRLFEMGKYAEAAETATAALGLDPANKQMLQYKASGYYYAGDYARAAEAFSDCLQADNRNGKLYLLRGHSYLLSRQPEKALADFSTANRYAAQLNAQEQSDLQYYWGMAYLDAERFDLATGSFNKALGMNPSAERKTDLERYIAETADKKAAYATVVQTRKDLERAKRNPRASSGVLQKIVENPQVTDELKAQAYGYLSYTGRTVAEDLAYADKAVALAPENYEYLMRQGILRYSLQNPKEALTSFDRALALNSEAPAGWAYRGLCYLDLEDWAAAEKNFSKAAEHPDNQVAYLYRARARFMLGNMDPAREDISKVPQEVPRRSKMLSAEYNYLLGLFAQQDKKYGEALDYYTRALNADASGSRGKDLQKRVNQLNSLKRWSEKR